MFRRAILRSIGTVLLTVIGTSAAFASPYIGAGDTVLRHDIQLLADRGVISGTTTTWPLAWGPLLVDINSYQVTGETPSDVVDALGRVKARAGWDTRSREAFFNARLSGADAPMRIRSFEDTPRTRGELSTGATYTSDWWTATVNAQLVDAPDDEDAVRFDRSVIAASVGNWSVGLNTLDRWWGPGWDGSIILSNNARPIPSISIDRTFTDAFESKWLSWIGPWDLSVHFGQMENDRVVPETQIFGMRFNFKPVPSLEIGLSRTAQWCGEGRPCSFDTFVDLLLGKDNRGDDDIDEENEPGNQLAGFDARWSFRAFGVPLALYGQFIGEDEAGGFPSRYLGQIGIEGTASVADRWSVRWFGEFAGTSCQFYETSKIYNCAYNHNIYETGYRYRGQSIGHGADNDAEIVSIGATAVNADGTEIGATIRFGGLNQGGEPDPAHSLTATSQDLFSVDVRYSRMFRLGQLLVGVGMESFSDEVSGTSDDGFRAFLQWRSSY